MKGNESVNILNLEEVEHALSECIQLLIDFWREKTPAQSTKRDMTLQLGRAVTCRKKEQINVLNL